VRDSLQAAGVTLRTPRFEELPFQFDNLVLAAQAEEKEGNYREAAQMFEYIGEHHRNELWISTLAAKAFFLAGERARAAELSQRINQKRPTVDTLLLEAKVRREQKDFASAIALLRTAEQLLSDPDLDVPAPLLACGHASRSAGGNQSENLKGNDFLWT
jgi:tetratricopeptide (TPR) repeat protein